MNKKRTISAVIACYKDGMAIPHMYKKLTDAFRKLEVNHEIIFVNDASPDDSEQVIKNIARKDSHVIGITHSRNFGSQMAFTSGMELARGDAVVLLDGDLQDPPEIIEKFYQKWIEGYEVVYGIRIKREASLFMQIMYKLFYRIFHKLSYVKMPVDAGDFSLLDRKVVDVLKKLPERDRFLRGLRAWVGFKQIGVPYVRPERMFGKTTNSILKNFDWALKGIFSFSYAPLRFITLLSLGVFLLSLLAMLVQIVLRFLYPETPRGTTAILVVVLFLGAIQLLGISILGEYIGKIFEEVKQRPPFIVKNIIRHK